MHKRGRGEDEVVEVYAALLRQSGARAVERIRQRRTNASPIDALVIRYAMYFLDTRAFPPLSYVTQAQRVITEAIERVSQPQHYAYVPLPALVESLVAENTAEVMQQTVAAIEEFIDARDALGRWIDDNAGNGDDYNDNEEDTDATVDLAGKLWHSALYWVAVLEYIEALSLSSAKVNAFALRPKYEKELMDLLNSVAAPHYVGYREQKENSSSALIIPSKVSSASSTTMNTTTNTVVVDDDNNNSSNNNKHNESKVEVIASDEDKQNSSIDDAKPITDSGNTGTEEITTTTTTTIDKVKEEEEEEEKENKEKENESSVLIPEPTRDVNVSSILGKRSDHQAVELARAASVSRLLASLTALANCPTDNPIAAGINPLFFSMVHARLNVLAACDRLNRFGNSAAVAPPPLTPSLQALQTQKEAAAEARKRREATRQNRDDNNNNIINIGVPLDFVPSEAYMRAALEKQNEVLGEDEELFKDEIVDYYKQHPQSGGSGVGTTTTSSSSRRWNTPQSNNRIQQQQQQQQQQRPEESTVLVKPHRFCKVKTGYTWTQYNRTHYDARTNPPPRSVLWYEFTLFYPALANTKRDMSRIYHIEDTIRGPNDDYCILVFSVGPPYADVAYQIVRKQWDTRPGGVRASFDSSGTYRLFFRFTNSNYRR